MILLLGALVTAYLGYRQHPMWVPGALAVGLIAAQFLLVQGIFGGEPSYGLYAVTLVLCLLVFYASFGIGRAIGLRIQRMRKVR